MKLEVNIAKKHFFILLGAILFLGIIIGVSAYNNIPNPGHGADALTVSIYGEEKTLQAAIDGGFGKDKIYSLQFDSCKWINVYNKDCNGVAGCRIEGDRVILEYGGENEGLAQGGPWMVMGFNHNSPDNGDAFQVCKVSVVRTAGTYLF